MNKPSQCSDIGTELKINIYMEPMDGYHLSDVEFYGMIYSVATGKAMNIAKDDTIEVDKDNRIALVDSGKIGYGRYYLKFTAYIPDTDFPDGRRQETTTVDTGITVKAGGLYGMP